MVVIVVMTYPSGVRCLDRMSCPTCTQVLIQRLFDLENKKRLGTGVVVQGFSGGWVVGYTPA